MPGWRGAWGSARRRYAITYPTSSPSCTSRTGRERFCGRGTLVWVAELGRAEGAMMSWFRWFQPNVRNRLARYNLRADVLDAAAAMASDQRSDVYVARLQSSLTETETVLRMMDGRYAGTMGLLVLTSERLLFRSRRDSGSAFSIP